MKKRMIGLFLALALCLSLLPAAAFAADEHTHYLCGEDNCTGSGNHAKTDMTTFATAIEQNETTGVITVGSNKPQNEQSSNGPYQCVLSDGGTYYLASDLVLKAPPSNQYGCIQIEGNVTLCLNGHTITVEDNREAFKITKSSSTASSTLTLTDCKGGGKITHASSLLGNGVNLSEGCSFIMYGGSITGNTTSGGEITNWRSGGVWVHGSNSTFTMYGGSITDNNTAWSGGGVCVADSGTFHMCGGTIGGNSATDGGGGVYVGSGSTFTMVGGSSITGNNAGNGGGVYANGRFTVSGAVQIKDNVCNGTKGSNGNYTGGTTSNVYLYTDKTITIDSGHLADGASIGVTTQTTPTGANSVAIATGANLADKQYFSSDAGENYLFYVTSGGTICMTAANAHGHPICGASCSHNGSGHASDETTWQPIGSAGELAAIPSSGGYYYLTDDVTLNSKSVWAPPSGTFLCLNGHTITGAAGKDTIVVGSGVNFTLTDCKGSGKITHENIDAAGCGVNVVGSFTMYGGSITGNHNPDGGGVMVKNTGSFTMYGGSITGNSVSGSGGGVYVAAYDGTQGSFTMYGGSITGNNATGSGGVDVFGSMTVSGSVNITGNVEGGLKGNDGIYTGDTASNVCLVGSTTITIDGPLTEGSQIGVTLYSNRIFTSGWSANMSDKAFSSYFTADDSSSTVELENGELKLSNPHTHSWTYTASGATITAKCNAADCTLADASGGSVTIAAPEEDALTYDGSHKAATVTISGDWPGASADNINITYKQGEMALSDAPIDAGTYTAGITVGEGNGAVTASVTYTIEKAALAAGDFTFAPPADLTYNGSAKTATVTTTKTGVDTVTVTYFKGETQVAEPKDAGNYTVKISVAESSNYKAIADLTAENWKFTIAKAVSACAAPTAITGLTYTGEAQALVTAGSATGGTMVYSTEQNGTYSETIPTGTNADTYTVWYKVKGDNNHNDTMPASVSVTIDKQPVAIPEADPTQFTYNGAEQTYTVAASDLYTVSGNVRKSAGTHTVTVTLRDTENYIWSDNTDAAKTFDFVIGKAQVIVTVKDKSAYVGSTAPDLSKPEPDKDYTVSGLIGEDKLPAAPTLKYVDETGKEIKPDMTKVGEVLIRADGEQNDNYVIVYVAGKLTVTTRPSSPSSSTTTKTETTTNPDGSVTKTETKSDGTVIETTTNKDGSTTKTEAKPDGSSKTEVRDANGSTGTVNTDKNGNTTAEAKITDKAISDAKKSDEAVKIPAEITPGEDSASAPTVKIDLPSNAGKTKIEIPVKDVTSGTVAVIVKPDGTEEIVKDSVPTENGIQLTVSGDVTVKIVNNAKDFADTKGHWAEESIDFASARGLVNGTSESTFAPDAATTRAQLWTILARQADADLTGGASWYEKAQDWAKASGISDGTDPNGTITRAQMVTMLYRAAGSPEVSGTSSFADVPADSYYAKAVAWAVENGITTGVGSGKFDPNGTCTRAQIATFLHRVYLSR